MYRYQVQISPTWLLEAFTSADPKSAKRKACNQCLDALLESSCAKVGEIFPEINTFCYTATQVHILTTFIQDNDISNLSNSI